jgi:hypothetical protein
MGEHLAREKEGPVGSVDRQRLLNDCWLGSYSDLLPPLRFRLALLVGCALARRDFVEGAALCLHPHVGIPGEHGARDVPGDAHDYLVAGTRLGELRDQRVAITPTDGSGA